MARVEIEQQISFFSFGFTRISEVRHIKSCEKVQYRNDVLYERINTLMITPLS